MRGEFYSVDFDTQLSDFGAPAPAPAYDGLGWSFSRLVDPLNLARRGRRRHKASPAQLAAWRARHAQTQLGHHAASTPSFLQLMTPQARARYLQAMRSRRRLAPHGLGDPLSIVGDADFDQLGDLGWFMSAPWKHLKKWTRAHKKPLIAAAVIGTTAYFAAPYVAAHGGYSTIFGGMAKRAATYLPRLRSALYKSAYAGSAPKGKSYTGSGDWLTALTGGAPSAMPGAPMGKSYATAQDVPDYSPGGGAGGGMSPGDFTQPDTTPTEAGVLGSPTTMLVGGGLLLAYVLMQQKKSAPRARARRRR